MKYKIIAYLLISFIAFSPSELLGCGKSITDDTGKINVGNLKHIYNDGSYIAYSNYFDGDGFAPALQVIISQGIISKVTFDYFTIEGKKLTDNPENASIERLAQIKADRQKLTNILIQNQEAKFENELPLVSKSGQDYYILANALLPSIVEYTKPIPVRFSCIYKDSIQTNQGEVFTLSVSTTGGDIKNISFRHYLPPQGIEAKDDNSYIESFFKDYNIDYKSAMETLSATKGSVRFFSKNLNEINIPAFLVEAFNSLADKISSIAHPFPEELLEKCF